MSSEEKLKDQAVDAIDSIIGLLNQDRERITELEQINKKLEEANDGLHGEIDVLKEEVKELENTIKRMALERVSP